MKSLIVRFIMSDDIVSKLIGWTTDSLWCHTEALSRDGRSWIGAHAHTGVQARPLDWTPVTRERRYEIRVTDEQYEAAMGWLESKLGTPYDYLDIAGLALHKRIGASDHEVICSACMLQFLIKALPYSVLNVEEGFAYLVTPETLHLSPVFMGRGVYAFPAAS